MGFDKGFKERLKATQRKLVEQTKDILLEPEKLKAMENYLGGVVKNQINKLN